MILTENHVLSCGCVCELSFNDETGMTKHSLSFAKCVIQDPVSNLEKMQEYKEMEVLTGMHCCGDGFFRDGH